MTKEENKRGKGGERTSMTLIRARVNEQLSIKQQRLSRSGHFSRTTVVRSFCPPSPSRTTTTYTTGARAEIVTRPSVGGGGRGAVRIG